MMIEITNIGDEDCESINRKLTEIEIEEMYPVLGISCKEQKRHFSSGKLN